MDIPTSMLYSTSSSIYFIECTRSVDKEVLQEILGEEEPPSDEKGWIIPKRGIRSAWGTKTLDLLRSCGLLSVTRIEKVKKLIDITKLDVLQERVEYTLGEALRSLSDKPFQSSAFKGLGLSDSDKPFQNRDFRTVNLEKWICFNQTNPSWLRYIFQTILQRDPTKIELSMFAQINSEHCRHKYFHSHGLFKAIKSTFRENPNNVISAYTDNAAVIKSGGSYCFSPLASTNEYSYDLCETGIVAKVETHNHPTALCPWEGSATGVGGEIRDEIATGIGGGSVAGMIGYCVSHFGLWEHLSKPRTSKNKDIKSPLEIMLEAPIGAAAFANEFGRPTILGYCRNFEFSDNNGVATKYGYDKPILIGGGIGQIRMQNAFKKDVPIGARIIVLGGPCLLVGLGGSAASSQTSEIESINSQNTVQRSNPEMQRKAYEVIRQLSSLLQNVILSLHDVGAGGLSTAVPEIVYDAGKGATIILDHVLCDDPSMTSMEIWCNESQERFVFCILEKNLLSVQEIAARENCPWSDIGVVTYSEGEKNVLLVYHNKEKVVDIPLHLYLDVPLPTVCEEQKQNMKDSIRKDFIYPDIRSIAEKILKFPTVGCKSYLITIADRTIGGLVVRDQMIGPYQIPVSDNGIVCNDFLSYTGSAIAIGERPSIAVHNPEASVRVAIAESLTNLASACIEDIREVSLSCNWMACIPEESDDLDRAVHAAVKLCHELGICIPVGKDSLSMKANGVMSPVTLVATAFANVPDVRQHITPQLKKDDSLLYFIDLSDGSNALGGSVLEQVLGEDFVNTPDIGNVKNFLGLFSLIYELRKENIILSYHDRSDGGLFTSLFSCI